MRRKRNFYFHLIKSGRTYETAELAIVVGVHPHTIHVWRKEGLNPIDDTHPFLFHGSEVIQFLKAKRQKNKIKLQPGEFRCPRCRKARKSALGNLSIQLTGKRMGIENQIIIRGVCESCNSNMVLFTTESKLTLWLSSFAQLPKGLLGCVNPCINLDLIKEQNL